MILTVNWPDGGVSEYDTHNFSREAINEFQAAIKVVVFMSQEYDVIIDDCVVSFVEKS
jgi:hypothetical protein